MKIFKFSFSFAIAILFMLFVSSYTSSTSPRITTGAEVIEIPFSVDRIIPCTGEEVSLQGVQQVIHNEHYDQSRGYHYVDQIHIKASGVGSYGNKYKLHLSDNFVYNVEIDGFPYVLWQNLHSRLISKGSAPNAKAHFVYHITINNNGETKAEFLQMNITCK